MKSKLLKAVMRRAKECAHWIGYTKLEYFKGECISGVTIGYGTEDDQKLYGKVLCYNMDEVTFDRIVRQKYWEYNRKRYYYDYILKSASPWSFLFGDKARLIAIDRHKNRLEQMNGLQETFLNIPSIKEFSEYWHKRFKAKGLL